MHAIDAHIPDPMCCTRVVVRSKHAQGNPQGNQINRHAIQVGVVDVGLYCNALAREARFRKVVPNPPISDQLARAQVLSNFDRDFTAATVAFRTQRRRCVQLAMHIAACISEMKVCCTTTPMNCTQR